MLRALLCGAAVCGIFLAGCSGEKTTTTVKKTETKTPEQTKVTETKSVEKKP